MVQQHHTYLIKLFSIRYLTCLISRDIRKGGRDAIMMVFDWQQDHTAISTSSSSSAGKSSVKGLVRTKERVKISTYDVTTFRKIDWRKVEACKAHDSAVMSIKVRSINKYTNYQHITLRLSTRIYTHTYYSIHHAAATSYRLAMKDRPSRAAMTT